MMVPSSWLLPRNFYEFLIVNHRAAVVIKYLDRGSVNQFCNTGVFFELNFIDRIGWLMVIFVNTCEKEDKRHAQSSHVPVVASPIELIAISKVVVSPVE